MKTTPRQAYTEAILRVYQLHENTAPMVEAVLVERTIKGRALALAELLDYLGLHPGDPHPAPRRQS